MGGPVKSPALPGMAFLQQLKIKSMFPTSADCFYVKTKHPASNPEDDL